jgi:hypothetical protein
MKISLRKANALQAAITEALAGLDFSNEIAINEFERPSEKLSNAKAQFLTNLVTRTDLINAVYDIRKKVADANARSEINNLLANIAGIEKEISFYSKLAKAPAVLNIDVIVGKLGKIKSRDEDQYYGRDDVVRTGIFTVADIDDFKAKLAIHKKLKVGLQDSLLELNVSTEINLSESTVEILKTVGII